MIRELVIFFVLGLTASGLIEDYRLLAPFAATPKTCSSPGLLCDTCSSLVACIRNSDNSWTKNPVGTCSPPSYCVNRICTTEYEPICWGVAAWSFPCPAVGTFPDPFYCNKFHMCVKDGSSLKDYVNECESGFGFNITNDLCNIKLDAGQCPTSYPLPLCNATGYTDAITEKPSMYYVCEERTVSSIKALYPYLQLCPGDHTYKNYQCTNDSYI